MRTLLLFLTFPLLAGSAGVWAASCPYCGQSYGEGRGSGADSGYIASIRAAHEASCASRQRPQPTPPPQRAPEPEKPKPVPPEPPRVPDPAVLTKTANWYAASIASSQTRIVELTNQADEYRHSVPYWTRMADAWEFQVRNFRETAERLERDHPKLEAATARMRVLAAESTRAAELAWRAYLQELEKLHRSGVLPAPLDHPSLPAVPAYGSREATERARTRGNQPKQAPRHMDGVPLEYYGPRSFGFEELRRQMLPQHTPPPAPRAASFEPRGYVNATQAAVNTLQAEWQTVQAAETRARAVANDWLAQFNAQGERYGKLIQEHRPAKERAMAADRTHRYLSDRLCVEVQDWATGKLKEAASKYALEELRRRAPGLANEIEKARAAAEGVVQRHAPFIEKTTALVAHARTMQGQAEKTKEFFGELRVVLANHFDSAQSDELLKKLELNDRELFSQAVQNAGGSERLASFLDFMVSTDLRELFKKQ